MLNNVECLFEIWEKRKQKSKRNTRTVFFCYVNLLAMFMFLELKKKQKSVQFNYPPKISTNKFAYAIALQNITKKKSKLKKASLCFHGNDVCFYETYQRFFLY